jgi:signal transduction histidine kinase
VDLVLDCAFPVGLSWGDDFIWFYNDPARRNNGRKHPAALGRSARVTFAEMWGVMGPICEHVRATGEYIYTVDQHTPYERYDYLEETYYTASNSPVWDAGRVAGVLSIFVETTDVVLAARRLTTVRDLAAGSAGAATPEGACVTAAEILERNALDVPFAALYLCDETGTTARRAAVGGLPEGHPAAPAEVVLALGAAGWPLAEVAEGATARYVDDMEGRFGAVEAGPWPEPPRGALVLPLRRSGHGKLIGFLVGGISARRELDAVYQDFYEMVAGHVATAISNSMAREDERKQAEALAALDRAKTLFFSDISHEFRTPLTLMLGPLEQLRAEMGPSTTSAAREMLEIAARNGARLRKLVDAVLDFARIEAGSVEPSLEPVDLPKLTAELAAMFNSAAESAHLRLHVDCPPLPEPTWVDPEMWEKIVLNLVSNAVKFTFEGEISVVLRDAGDAVELTVRDTGVGIPDDDLPRVFQRFHRARGVRSRSHEGSGIGLALVSELAHLHGGTARAESRVNEGTTITVVIPKLTAAARRGGSAPRAEPAGVLAGTATGAEIQRWVLGGAQPPSAPPSEPGRARVLVVEDNADMRTYLVRVLSAHYDVTACADGGEALEVVRRALPALVLSDVMMPRVDGVELVRQLRAGSNTAALPVVLLSAQAGDEHTVAGLAAGADDYLVKPFSTRELLARVDAHLAQARLRQYSASTEERNRIARDLHDSVMQTLITATLQAEALATASDRVPEGVAAEVQELASTTRAAMAEMRVLLTEMRPDVLERARLGHLVFQLADALPARVPVSVRTHVDDTGSDQLPPAVRVAVYRIAQESLTNVAKHSRASAVEISLAATAATVDLGIRDDGIGFEPDAVTEGLGLMGTRERAAAVGATLRVHSRPRSGTEVTLHWPGMGNG